MHKPSLSQLVYNHTFPRPKANDPSSFAAHITRNLVPEVRIEISTFYGTLDCIEAQYPGLDYAHPPHRMRLGRFPWHRRLFRTFDELRLTKSEIAGLCRWEGTKSARDRYERDEKTTVRDTTADDVRVASPPPHPTAYRHSWTKDSTAPGHVAQSDEEEEHEVMVEEEDVDDDEEDEKEELIEDDEVSEDDEVESYGVALNQRLLAATEARERGADVVYDEQFELWMKEAMERGGYEEIINYIQERHPLPVDTASSTSVPVPSPIINRVSSSAMAINSLLSAESGSVASIGASGSAIGATSATPAAGAAR